ncbi:MAG: RNA 2',3'-cyclic phosphodiesterase [Lachnospiraceae bacterium]|nr:RNA 2',3'-cyclic phosphodiesterase [Lachnospiraceae bacterium]
MRLFIAVQLDQGLKKAILDAMQDMKAAGVRGRFVSADNLHLTLAFIGETDRIREIREALQSVSFEPFEISASGIGAFRDLLWVGLSESRKLTELSERVRGALDERKIGHDGKRFLAHITIVRDSRGFENQITPPEGKTIVRKTSLMRSDVINGKRVYTELS